MNRIIGALSLLLVSTATVSAEPAAVKLRIGCKAFTESVIVGELVRQLAESAGTRAQLIELGGTQVVWRALLAGEIDIYPEYTGTLLKEILASEATATSEEVQRILAHRGLRATRSLGFVNNYVIGVSAELAAKHALTKISDLRDHPELRLGFSNEFLRRDDGWPALRSHYQLRQRDVRGLDHDLAYRALADGQIDATDFYSTDGKLRRYSFAMLTDDAHFFPVYEAILLYREEVNEKYPQAWSAIARLEGSLDEATMINLNGKVDVESTRPRRVAADYLESRFQIMRSESDESAWEILRRNGLVHLRLVALSLCLAILVAVPLGILAAKWERVGQAILAVVGLFQTIPSIVLLVLLIPLLGVGDRPAIFALFIYSLLPIVRNTYAGLRDVPRSLLESAEAVGLPALARLRRVELPLAARSVLAGIKTAAVINVGTATLGGLIGAGGFGDPIFQGLRAFDPALMIWQGAVPTAVLSLAVLGIFEVIERFCVPKGLRLRPSST
ncbi:ABC transporter permease subunit [bacterium]|nr:ABC transporter permease subunit [bacterium]